MVITCNNQWLATDNQANFYGVQVIQEESKPPQTENTLDNSTMLVLFQLFYAQVMV